MALPTKSMHNDRLKAMVHQLENACAGVTLNKLIQKDQSTVFESND